MRQRRLVVASVLALAATGVAEHARGSGALLPGADAIPREQRVAVAAGADRVTVWTSLQVSSSGGPIGYVIPVPPGASLDYASDAWLETLEVITAPRVLPPDGVSPYCPGQSGGDDPFDMTGEEQHIAGLLPADFQVLADVAAVDAWAQQEGLTVPAATADKLGQAAGMRFAAARFTAPSGKALTRTIRIVSPGAVPAIPLTLTAGAGDDVRVTVWTLGPGRGALEGTTAIGLSPANLSWSAEQGKSDYDAVREQFLVDGGPTALLTESARDQSLTGTVEITSSAVVPSLIQIYYKRAGSYGDGDASSGACVNAALPVLASSDAVATACPRAELGVVDGTDTCVEAPMAGESDPAALRCGEGADDLAVALSGLVPTDVWVTRHTMVVRDGVYGADWPLAFDSGSEITPVLTAGQLDTSQCADPSSSASTGASSGGPSGAGPSGGGPSGAGVIFVEDPDTDVGCSCSDTSDTYSDDGSGGEPGTGGGDGDDDGSTEDDGGASTEDDGCGGDTESESDGDSCGGDTESESSGSETDDGCDCGGTESDSGDDGGDDGGSGSDDSCDCGGGKCAVAAEPPKKARKKSRTRLSALSLAALAIILPIRRRTRRRKPR